MLDFYKRAWQILFPVFAVLLVGMIQMIISLSDKWYMPLTVISLAIISLLIFIIALTCFIKDYLEAHRKDKESKAPSVYEKRGFDKL